jgi:putative two-component system response regulator
MNRRVLLVDDSCDFLAGVQQLLAPRFEVSLAASGAEALARCEQGGPFAVVVSDYGMPGMTGIELLAELAQHWPDTARILLTGCADLGLALEALDRGAIYRFLTKPPIPARLVEAVASGTARYHAIEEERALTEQLAFARESLQALNGALEERLERELSRLDALARGSENIASSSSPEEVLERATEAVREILGARAGEVHLGQDSALTVAAPGELRASERRSLAILSSSARGALAVTLRRESQREAQRATLLALQRTARQRDDDTGEHLARVSGYVRELAEGLRASAAHHAEVSPAFVEDLVLAAPLHDIGKVAIPDAILFKPGKLDEREWEVMQRHAEIGAEILRGVHAGTGAGLLELAREIAWTHHERWDGSGYPRRLARAAIPLAGRIMALADCYDALTSERPYKHAWPHHAAATYIEEQSGLAFDPDLVAVFRARQEVFAAIRAGEHQPSAHGPSA